MTDLNVFPTTHILCPFCGQSPTLTGTATRQSDKRTVNRYTCSCSWKNSGALSFSCYVYFQNETECLDEFYLFQKPFKINWATNMGWEIAIIEKTLIRLIDAGENDLTIPEAFQTLKRYAKLSAFT